MNTYTICNLSGMWWRVKDHWCLNTRAAGSLLRERPLISAMSDYTSATIPRNHKIKQRNSQCHCEIQTLSFLPVTQTTNPRLSTTSSCLNRFPFTNGYIWGFGITNRCYNMAEIQQAQTSPPPLRSSKYSPSLVPIIKLAPQNAHVSTSAANIT